MRFLNENEKARISQAIEEVAEAEKIAPLFLCPTPGAVLREEYLGAAKLDAAGFVYQDITDDELLAQFVI